MANSVSNVKDKKKTMMWNQKVCEKGKRIKTRKWLKQWFDFLSQHLDLFMALTVQAQQVIDILEYFI